MNTPEEDLNELYTMAMERVGKDNPILVPESFYDTAVRISNENNILVKIEPVKAAWKTDEI